ncbi:hypothetical protein B0H13DRAFT_2338852 [Mycena leptocephala]|nr:hypothetical protein B0H13DRAFT_2338852 [Mycena leptocephala]
MSTIRAAARKEMLSALTIRTAGPFSDATNTVGSIGTFQGTSTQKPVSRRVARQRSKRTGGNATREVKVSFLVPRYRVRLILLGNKKHDLANTTAIAESVVKSPPSGLSASSKPLRAIPTLIVRTLPGPPAKKFYGPFEACSREDMLVEETRTWEEDAWGIIYGPHDIAASVAGPVRVITHQGEPGSPGGVQIFYG